MFTVKVKWFRSEGSLGIVDESTMFFAADSVQVGSEILKKSELKHWPEGSYFNYAIENNDQMTSEQSDFIDGTKMVQIIRDGKSEWCLCSLAWLLGPDGKTIEKLTT